MEAQPVRVPISKRLILINSTSSVVARLLTAGVFLWVIRYLLLRIPEAELALLPIVMAVAMLLPLIQTVLSAGLARHVTEAYARNDLVEVTRIVSSQFPLLLAGGLVLMAVGGAAAWNIHHILTVPPAFVGELRFMLLLVVGRLALGMALAPFNTGLFALQKFVWTNAIEVASSVLRAGLTLWLVLGVSPRVVWVILALVASQVFMLVASTTLSMRVMPALRFRPSLFDWQTSQRVLSFGAWQFVLELAAFIRRAADPPILNELASPLAVNNFFLGSAVETQLRELAIRATQPLLPALTAMHVLEQQARLAAAFLRSGRLAIWASMLVAVPLMVFSYDVFHIYLGDKYTEHYDAATVMILLLLGFPLTYPTTIFFRIAFARGDVRPVAIRAIGAQLGNLALTLLLVGRFQLGAIGSAVATLVTFLIVHPFFHWPLAVRTLQLSWRRFFEELLLPGLFPAAAAACGGLLVMPFLGDSSVVRIAVGFPVCMIVYGVGVWLALKPADRADLGRIRQFQRRVNYRIWKNPQ